jgi:hypothetical protein
MAAIVAFQASAAQAAARPLTPAEKMIIQHGVESELLDPDGAKFRLGPDQPAAKGFYCGLVNAKNAYGGYTGFTVFFIMVERNAKGQITEAKYPDLLTRGGGELRAMATRAGLTNCREAGFQISY